MKNILPLAVILLMIAGCSPSMSVFSDYDHSLSVAAYKTFSWTDTKTIEEKGTTPHYITALTNERIRNAVQSALLNRGLTAAAGTGDLEVHYHIIIDNKTMVITEPYGSKYSPYLEKKNSSSTYAYKEGSLVIDLTDTRTHELVWRGWATDVITEREMQKPEEAINHAVQEIFKKSPFAVR
ncbi:MAG: DUF4136 domain-containing protein [Ferruginibacter sp.]